MNLIFRLVTQSILGFIAIGIVIFIPAGTLLFWRGWAFIAVFAASATYITAYLVRTDRALLERRMKAGPGAETRPVQKALMLILFVAFWAMPALSVLDYRFGWSKVPTFVSILGDFLVAFGLAITFCVLLVNSYGAATIKHMEGQKVISTGPYAIVRHPMYTGALIMLAGVPLALGSYWCLLFLLLFLAILVLRILDEESMLRTELDGYVAYMQHVRSRLAPGLW